ncbi:nuclear transport factor 2 family protein [Rhodococcus sp. NPDC058514]|uniref:nuclear transport factor 2 family protein n=1 Tax=unclassified Rhodococcus (in: high G+C Gram-positive bacteria) TaxID=192944 RepID=UPI0036664C5B
MGFGFLAGVSTALACRAVLLRALLFKFNRDVRALNAGDYHPLLRSYHRDAVLRFADGDHRWAGVHNGRDAIERFLRDFVHAGLQGEVSEAYFGGVPWRMTLVARFNDRADGPDGLTLYRNRTVLLVRTRWGKIVEQEDFYEDTSRIEAFETRLRQIENSASHSQSGKPNSSR